MAKNSIAQQNTPRDDLTAEFVRSILDYNPNTGVFRWRVRRDMKNWWNGRYAGNIAGCIDNDGYIIINIYNKRYTGHRLAWLYVTGKWPTHDVDHKDPPRTNNRFANLREATRRQNIRNQGLRPNNTSGFKGVSWCKTMKAWKAQIRDDKTNRYLGCFPTKELAYARYCQAATEIHGEFARFR